MMRLAAWIGLRHAFRGGRRGYVSFVSVASLLSLYLGVVALIVVVSVMNGFDRELKQRILGVAPHLLLEGAGAEAGDGRAGVAQAGEAQAAAAKARAAPQVAWAAPFIRVKGLVTDGGSAQLADVYGIDPSAEPADSPLARALGPRGLAALQAQPDAVFLGRALGYRLRLAPGDALTLALPEASGGQLRPRLLRLRLGGFFRLRSPLDYSLAVMPVAGLAERLGREPGLRVMLKEPLAAEPLARQWRQAGLAARSWADEHGDFFATVRMEKIMMFLLLSFVLAIASFGMVASLSMMVEAKQRDIAVLMTLGFPVGGVMAAFMLQGMSLALLGIAAGVATGVPAALAAPAAMGALARLTGIDLIAGTWFDAVPVDIRWPDVAAVALVAAAISWLATLYPSWRAAQLRPAQILRDD